MDLTRGLKMCSLYIQKAEVKGAPEDRLELLRQWLGDAKSMLDEVKNQGAQERMRMKYQLAAEVREGQDPEPPPGVMPAPGEDAAATLPGSEEPMAGTDPAMGVATMVQ